MKKILGQDTQNHEHIKISVTCNNGKIKELMTCNELCGVVEEQHEHKASGEMGTFRFHEILEHQGLRTPGDV